MTNKIQISISKPCQENWNKMNTSEKGKFCASCQKDVIDFTTFSNREIIKEFNTNTNLCGRFLVNQINRELIIPKERKIVWLAAVSTIISFLSSGKLELSAQESVKTEQTESKKNEHNTLNRDNKEVEVSGKIFLDETNPNFEEVKILVYSKNQIFHPYTDGKFYIIVNKNDELLISKVGYINYYAKINGLTNLGAIELEKDNCQTFVVGGAIAKRRSFWYRLFHKAKS